MRLIYEAYKGVYYRLCARFVLQLNFFIIIFNLLGLKLLWAKILRLYFAQLLALSLFNIKIID